ncbi:membrane protein, partial [Rhodococcus rhodochrous]
PLWVATPSHRARLVLRVLVSAQAGTRGPPRTA